MRSSKLTTSNDKLHSDGASTKSLTPQRKHRKLLKDGTSEVWPEEIEKIFVQGLRQYWESPWATYSRGRSRWRNQFLVDYLQKAGVERSKKQVASHIQVLRNMWKGEPEYHLVAGGEELFVETGLLAHVKSEEPCDSHLLTPLQLEEMKSHSPASLFTTDSPLLSPRPKHMYPRHCQSIGSMPSGSMPSAETKEGCRSRSLSRSRMKGTDHQILSFFSPYQNSDPRSQLYLPPEKMSPQGTMFDASMEVGYDYSFGYSNCASEPSSPEEDVINLPLPLDPSLDIYDELPFLPSDPSVAPTSRPVRGMARLTLWTEGMLPFTVQVDALKSSQPFFQWSSTVAIRIKLHLPTIDAMYSPTLHGFHGSITFTAQRTSARCFTSVFARNACIVRESENCPIMTVEPSGQESFQTAVSYLPESSLSRSRWLDASIETSIVQKIFVDDGLLAVVVYDLDRENCDNMPSAELTGFSKYNAPPEKPQRVCAPNHPPPTHTQSTPRSCYPAQASLPSAALSFDNRNSTHSVSSFSSSTLSGMTTSAMYQ